MGLHISMLTLRDNIKELKTQALPHFTQWEDGKYIKSIKLLPNGMWVSLPSLYAHIFRDIPSEFQPLSVQDVANLIYKQEEDL